MNRPYLGDNLEWLRDRREFPDARVDLLILIGGRFFADLIVRTGAGLRIRNALERNLPC